MRRNQYNELQKKVKYILQLFESQKKKSKNEKKE